MTWSHDRSWVVTWWCLVITWWDALPLRWPSVLVPCSHKSERLLLLFQNPDVLLRQGSGQNKRQHIFPQRWLRGLLRSSLHVTSQWRDVTLWRHNAIFGASPVKLALDVHIWAKWKKSLQKNLLLDIERLEYFKLWNLIFVCVCVFFFLIFFCLMAFLFGTMWKKASHFLLLKDWNIFYCGIYCCLHCESFVASTEVHVAFLWIRKTFLLRRVVASTEVFLWQDELFFVRWTGILFGCCFLCVFFFFFSKFFVDTENFCTDWNYFCCMTPDISAHLVSGLYRLRFKLVTSVFVQVYESCTLFLFSFCVCCSWLFFVANCSRPFWRKMLHSFFA